MTNLYQQWRDIAEAERTQEAGEKFWNDYFEAETENYKKLLADHEKVYSGKISELAPMFNMDEPTFVGFIDGINTSLKTEIDLDTLESDSASLTSQQQSALYEGVNEDYSHINSKKRRYEQVREDPYYNALQLKYAQAITCHKAQGGQWDCVFIDCPFWEDEMTRDDLKWMYTALTRAKKKVYLVNFRDAYYI